MRIPSSRWESQVCVYKKIRQNVHLRFLYFMLHLNLKKFSEQHQKNAENSESNMSVSWGANNSIFPLQSP